jgi:hypothetical protein
MDAQEQQIKELQIIVDRTKLKKIRGGLIEKLNSMGDNIEKINNDEILKITNTINAIDNILNGNNDNGNNDNEQSHIFKNIPEQAINTKEDIQTLKGLTVGNEEYEDWQLIRKAFRICIIEKLLK